MIIWLVTSDISPGYIGIRAFKTEEDAWDFIDENEDDYHMNNPRKLDTEKLE